MKLPPPPPDPSPQATGPPDPVLTDAVVDLVHVLRGLLRAARWIGPIIGLALVLYVVQQVRQDATLDRARKRYDAAEGRAAQVDRTNRLLADANAKQARAAETDALLLATALRLTDRDLTDAERAQVRADLDVLRRQLEAERREADAAQAKADRATSSSTSTSRPARGSSSPPTSRGSPAPRSPSPPTTTRPGPPPGPRPSLPPIVPPTVLDPVLRPVCSIVAVCTPPP